jgi:hypothetical protein
MDLRFDSVIHLTLAKGDGYVLTSSPAPLDQTDTHTIRANRLEVVSGLENARCGTNVLSVEGS